MKKLKQIVLKPLTDLDNLELNVSSMIQYDLPDLESEKIAQIIKELNNNFPDAILGTNVGDKSYVNTHIKGAQNKNRIFSFPEPNPICIYYNSANNHLQFSYDLKNKLFSGKQHYDFNKHYENFVEYFQETSEGVILLSTTIEGFINQLIPEEFLLDINGKQLTKAEIEWLDIKSKLRDLIPTLTGIDFYRTNKITYECISNIISLRNDLVHLKRILKTNNTSYQLLFKRLLDFEHLKCSDSVFTFINTLKPNYFTEV